MTHLDDRKSHSPLPEDRKRTIAEKVEGNGLTLAPEDVADQEAARRSGALNRTPTPPDPRDDNLVSSAPADQRDELLADVRDARKQRPA